MDYKNLVADKQLILPKHYTAGRGGQKISMVVLHHNAGVLSAEQIYQTWITREASAHYQVDVNGVTSQHVWDSNTAWHCPGKNSVSIGIEHSNSGGASAGWPVTEATRKAGAKLTAAVCKYYGLGRPQYGKNVFVHSDFYATACPVQLRDKYLSAYMAEAQAFYDSGLTGGSTASSSSTSTTTTATATTITAADSNDTLDWINKNMKATHVIFQYGSALYMANILAGTYGHIPNTQTLTDMTNALPRTGAKVAEWKSFASTKSNKVSNPAVFGIKIG